MTALTGSFALALIAGEWLGMPPAAGIALAVGGYLSGSWRAAIETFPGLLRGKADIELLMILAAAGAAAIGHYDEGIVLLFLFSLSHVIEDIAQEKSRRAITSILRERPSHATVLRPEGVALTPIEEIDRGDILRLHPGEIAPVDGVVREGETTMDESTLTGEFVPISKRGGDRVMAGAVNRNGSIDVTVTEPAAKSTLARIVQCAERAQERKSRFQSTIERLENRYAAGVLAGVTLYILVLWFAGFPGPDAFYRGIVLLVVASPCALVLSTPAATLAAIAAGARQGIIFKGGSTLEKLAHIDAVMFDKTGTLTTGRPRVTDIILSPDAPQDYTEETLLAEAAALEARSEHVIAKEIVRAARERHLDIGEVVHFEAEPGMGIHADLDGYEVWVGNARLFNQHGEAAPDWLMRAKGELESAGKSTVIVHRCRKGTRARDKCKWLGLLGFLDPPRDSALKAIAELRKLGVQRIALLTGDNAPAAERLAGELALDEFHADLLPEEKIAWVERFENQWGRVLMIGDGINDVPALARATVGCAMGGTGIDTVLHRADCVLMGDELLRVPAALALGRRATRIARQNLTFALGSILILTACSLAGSLPLALGVLGHEGSTVLVCLNGLRILRNPRPGE
ncbi:MAG: heavy metal translocating P-type ATPase [Candidatus Hydrogenedentes bacterium]|nr:heavy metal translocating P-type ATPase [Candidatus Hydrogenedentota bacterium]